MDKTNGEKNGEGRKKHREKFKRIKEERKNKARYTANTICGQVGRGGFARFSTFQLVLTDQRTDGRTNGRTVGRTKPLIELRVRN